MDIEVSNAGGANWVLMESIINQPEEWLMWSTHIADHITLTSEMVIRISVIDEPNNSLNEGAIDAVEIFDVQCD